VLIRQVLITTAQLRELLELQATQDRAWQQVGDLAVERGYVSADEIAAALRAAPWIDVEALAVEPAV
jgi:hypothetical protein